MTNATFISMVREEFESIVDPVMLSKLYQIEYVQAPDEEEKDIEVQGQISEIPVDVFSQLTPT